MRKHQGCERFKEIAERLERDSTKIQRRKEAERSDKVQKEPETEVFQIIKEKLCLLRKLEL